jgi:hypothetical protein
MKDSTRQQAKQLWQAGNVATWGISTAPLKESGVKVLLGLCAVPY